MKHMLKFASFSLFVALLVTACGGSKKNTKSPYEVPEKTSAAALKIKDRLEQFCYLLEGSFSSEEQHQKDPLGFYNISMHIYRIWNTRDDAKWFYVEQALASLPNEPYRQRVYKVYLKDRDTVVSEVYSLEKPKQFVGAWKQAFKPAEKSLFDELSPDDLKQKMGCSVYIIQELPGVYVGNTHQGECPTDRPDSKYIMSDVFVNIEKLVSWDRGYDENHQKTWGAESGYTFNRMPKAKVIELLGTPE